jgi:hypothetical protein
MACPHCGCRMLTKGGTGAQAQLICCDCGKTVPTRLGSVPAKPRRSQWITLGLLVGFAITAAGLMTIKDQQDSSLIEEQMLNLNQRRQSAEAMQRKRWSMVPRLPAHNAR